MRRNLASQPPRRRSAEVSTVGALIIAIMLVLPGQAHAQAFDWRGFYAGINVGGAAQKASFRNAIRSENGSFPLSTIAGINEAGHGSERRAAFLVGAQAGVNWQAGNLVLGLEFDAQRLNTDLQRVSDAVSLARYTWDNEVSAGWLATARTRLGWSFGNVLVYATGGVAWMAMRLEGSFSGGGTSDKVDVSSRQRGWIAGGGIEWAFDRSWTLRGEYLYADFDRIAASGNRITDCCVDLVELAPLKSYADLGPIKSTIRHSADLSLHLARVGLNYRF